jgi:hypothetical protein
MRLALNAAPVADGLYPDVAHDSWSGEANSSDPFRLDAFVAR